MSAGGLPDEPAGRQAAEAVTSPDVLAEAAVQAKAEHAVPDDLQHLKEEIERTREHLGETVQQLAAKTDVKAIARTKTAELTERVWASLEPMRRVVAKEASNARESKEYRASLALAGVSVILGLVAAWLWRQPQAGRHGQHADRRRR
jgi:hypothetical protein